MYPPGVPDFNLSNLLPDVYMHRCLAQDAPDGELEDMIGGPQMLIYVMEFMEHGNFNVTFTPYPCLSSTSSEIQQPGPPPPFPAPKRGSQWIKQSRLLTHGNTLI